MLCNERRFHLQAKEEVRILDYLRKEDLENNYNFVQMYEYFEFRNHKCITFEMLNMNLFELIKRNKFQGFNLKVNFFYFKN